jgi:hypothetical protein
VPLARITSRICVLFACVCAVLPCPAKAQAVKTTPLILEKDQGERRVWRPIEGAKGWDAEPGPFIFKVDRHNGGSSRLVFVTEDLPPGAKIDRHTHAGADEIIFLQNGRARVILGSRTSEVPR